ncbi:MAG: anti-sigma factor family protein [Mangrovicoccus sp.]
MTGQNDADQDDLVLLYLQDRMDPRARQTFEARLAAEPELAAELEFMRKLRQALDADELPKAEIDAGWEKLSDHLEMPAAQPANLNRPIALWKAAAMAAAAVALWQFAAVPQLGPTGGFAPVSEQAEAFELQVMFVPEASLGEINTLLYQIGAQVIDGPGALGIYRLRFVDATAQNAAATTLGQSSQLVSMVTQP